MKVLAIVTCILLFSCTMTSKYLVTGKNPTHVTKCDLPVTAVLIDFVTSVTMMGIGQIKFMADKQWQGYAWTVPGTVLMFSAYGAELACRVR